MGAVGGGGSGGGVGNGNATSTSDAGGAGLAGDADSGGSNSLWGSVGLGVGGTSRTGAVPASGQAIWGANSLLDGLDGALSGGGGGGVGAGGGEGSLSSLLLPPGSSAGTSAVEGSSSIQFSSAPLDLSSWGVSSGSAGRAGGSGAVDLAGEDFAGGLSVSLGGLQLDEPDTVAPLGGTAASQQPQRQQHQHQHQRNLFGATGSDSGGAAGGLSWG